MKAQKLFWLSGQYELWYMDYCVLRYDKIYFVVTQQTQSSELESDKNFAPYFVALT